MLFYKNSKYVGTKNVHHHKIFCQEYANVIFFFVYPQQHCNVPSLWWLIFWKANSLKTYIRQSDKKQQFCKCDVIPNNVNYLVYQTQEWYSQVQSSISRYPNVFLITWKHYFLNLFAFQDIKFCGQLPW